MGCQPEPWMRPRSSTTDGQETWYLWRVSPWRIWRAFCSDPAVCCSSSLWTTVLEWWRRRCGMTLPSWGWCPLKAARRAHSLLCRQPIGIITAHGAHRRHWGLLALSFHPCAGGDSQENLDSDTETDFFVSTQHQWPCRRDGPDHTVRLNGTAKVEQWREPGGCDSSATFMSSELETTNFFDLDEDDCVHRFSSSTEQSIPSHLMRRQAALEGGSFTAWVVLVLQQHHGLHHVTQHHGHSHGKVQLSGHLHCGLSQQLWQWRHLNRFYHEVWGHGCWWRHRSRRCTVTGKLDELWEHE